MDLFPVIERLTRRAMNASGVRSRFVETPVAKIHLYDAPGDGSLPTVVVLHGIGSSSAAYAPLIRKLRTKARRVLAPDAPGHGLSGAPISALTPDSLVDSISRVIDEHLDEPAIVYGCSLGGAVALSYALARPARVKGLMLASPAGAAMSQPDLDRLLRTFDLRSRADADELMARLYHKAPWYTPLIAPALQKVFARPVITSFISSVKAERLLTAEQVGSLSMPVHLLWGRSDRLMPPSSLDFYQKSLPAHATIEEPPGIGHCPHLDDPAGLAEKIAQFAATCAAPR